MYSRGVAGCEQITRRVWPSLRNTSVQAMARRYASVFSPPVGKGADEMGAGGGEAVGHGLRCTALEGTKGNYTATDRS
jgi:hypothetical protein